eukprot:SAG22_NODE_5905_length_933_cov_1.426859_2_plen_82_part_00
MQDVRQRDRPAAFLPGPAEHGDAAPGSNKRAVTRELFVCGAAIGSVLLIATVGLHAYLIYSGPVHLDALLFGAAAGAEASL